MAKISVSYPWNFDHFFLIFELYFNHKLKPSYIEAAAHLDDAEKIKFGKEGEYFQLSQKCFTYRSPSYLYRLCPFSNATQDEGTNPNPVLLGQGGTLNFADPNTPKVRKK